jgi:hypothetical protein
MSHNWSKNISRTLDSATPNHPSKNDSTTISKGIKIATSNLFVLNDIPPTIEATFSLVFENLVATELTGFLKHDMVKGENLNYQPFSNLGTLSQQYSPFNIIQLSGTTSQFLNDFAYSLEIFVPSVGYGTNGEIVYIDKVSTSSTKNSIIINLINISDDERVEVEFLTYDSLRSDTIYK